MSGGSVEFGTYKPTRRSNPPEADFHSEWATETCPGGGWMQISNRIKRIRLVVIVLIVGLHAAGCVYTRTYHVTFGDITGRATKSVQWQCLQERVQLKITSSGADFSSMWSVGVDIEFSNNTEGEIIHDWSEASLTFGESREFVARYARVKGNYLETPIILPPGKRIKVRLNYSGSWFWEEFRDGTCLTYKLGKLRRPDGMKICDLPVIYAHPTGKSIYEGR